MFDCDFGKLGIQICYDMEFDYGWNELPRKGAELMAWPTQSPQTSQPAFRAMQNRCYIVSSTWRNNASVFEPTGKIPAQMLSPDKHTRAPTRSQLCHPAMAAKLQKGEALRKKYGDKVWISLLRRRRLPGSSGPMTRRFQSPRWRVPSAFSRRSRCSSEFDRCTTRRRCADTDACECPEWYARCDFVLR